ncbi:MAG: hypothetical protein FWG13_05020 [Leptospirales bacterium]|nr:hypothetical protein [Leptospirales bacterium]
MFIIILINIFIGVALYLVMSLKLERSFRQQRLRREMDEMLKEFNLAAERNISLLESRINVMKRLLEQSGAFKGFDLLVDDNGAINTEGEGLPEVKSDAPSVTLKQSLRGLKTAVSGGIKVKKKKIIVKLDEKYADESEVGAKEDDSAALITKDISTLNFEEKAEEPFGDARLSELFSASDDENALIVSLVSEGCPWDAITRFSGKPAGEIRLILNYFNYTSK